MKQNADGFDALELGIHNIRAVEIVLSDGSILRKENPGGYYRKGTNSAKAPMGAVDYWNEHEIHFTSNLERLK